MQVIKSTKEVIRL